MLVDLKLLQQINVCFLRIEYHFIKYKINNLEILRTKRVEEGTLVDKLVDIWCDTIFEFLTQLNLIGTLWFLP